MPPTPPRIPIAVSWSGGKDSTLALAAALAHEGLEVRALVTTAGPATSEAGAAPSRSSTGICMADACCW